jgi:hypothetical protein
MATDLQLAASSSGALTESDLRINSNNLQQFIGGANQSNGGMLVFASNNGGANWSTTSLPLVAGHSFLSDPTFDWTSDGTAWALAIAFSTDASGNPTNLQVASFKSTSATSSSPTWTFDSIVSGTQTNTDKASLWVDRSPTSTFKDNMYAIWHNGVQSFVARRPGPLGTWQTPVQVSGSETSFTSDGGDIKTNQSGDVFAFWPDAGGQTLLVAKSTNGGVNFGSPVQIAATSGKFEIGIPAQNSRRVLIYITAGAFKTANEDLVFAAWMDLAGGNGCNAPGNEPGGNTASNCKSRIWFVRSTDGGTNWSTPIKINDQASKNDQFHPRLTVDEITGELVIIYYDTVNDPGRVKTDVWMQRSSDFGVSWTGAAKITSAQTDETSASANANQFGDYIGMTGHSGSFFGCWTDPRSGGSEQIWGAPIVTTGCQFLVENEFFGQDQVEVQLPGVASFTPAFFIQVDGFRPSELGLTSGNLANPPAASIPVITLALDPALPSAVASAIQSMFSASQFAGPVVPLDSSLPDQPQSFLFPFTATFNGDGGFLAMRAAAPAIEFTIVTLSASLSVGQSAVTSSAQIVLTTGENPYFNNIDPQHPAAFPSWLSFDLRFFTMTVPQGQTAQKFAATMTTNPADAPGFIADVIDKLNTGQAGSDTFDGLFQDEEQSKLEFQQADSNGNPVFNFALARVRLVAKSQSTAKTVRVFFRLFQAQNTASDFNTSTTFRVSPAGSIYGARAPLLGVQNDQSGNPEYVTIPCFASPRINLTGPADMNVQPDPPNARDINTNPGQEVDTYFGCWLDTNQPNQKFLPLNPPNGNFDGPWTNEWNNNQVHSIQEAMNVFPHQCLIAEIRFDDTPIPSGANTSTSDKLAQRNIAWIDGPNPGQAASRVMSHPVQVRPTPPVSVNPDELMVFWNNTPHGSEARLYLPAFSAAEILRLADHRHTGHRLRLIDANTIACPTGGATFIPLPKGAGLAAGLLSIDLPPGIRKGDAYSIFVRQMTDAAGNVPEPPPPPPRLTVAARPNQGIAANGERIAWRRTNGAFQFTITISTKERLLVPEERLLAVLRWVALITPKQKRWYPVLVRYIEEIVGRVVGFGGDPAKIKPSPIGQIPPLPSHEPDHDRDEDEDEFTGKIEGIIYDHFGDFDGFILATDRDRHHRFRSREAAMYALVLRVWRERIRVTVIVEPHQRHVPRAVILHAGRYPADRNEN